MIQLISIIAYIVIIGFTSYSLKSNSFFEKGRSYLIKEIFVHVQVITYIVIAFWLGFSIAGLFTEIPQTYYFVLTAIWLLLSMFGGVLSEIVSKEK